MESINTVAITKAICDTYMKAIAKETTEPRMWQHLNLSHIATEAINAVNKEACLSNPLTADTIHLYIEDEVLEDVINGHLYNHCAIIEERALVIINDQHLQDWRTNDQSWNALINALAVNEGPEYRGYIYLKRDSRFITASIANPVDVLQHSNEPYDWEIIGLAYISGL